MVPEKPVVEEDVDVPPPPVEELIPEVVEEVVEVVPEPEPVRIEGEFRVWTSASGAQVEAEFVEEQMDLVVLRTPQDKLIQIALTQLHRDDQIWVRQQMGHGAASRAASGGAVIRVDSKPRQQMIYGMDFERLWHLGALRDLDGLARLAVQECKVDYVRVAINGAAEIEEGKLDWSVYDGEIFRVMRAFQKANPRIKFFASPRPFHEAVPGSPFTSFPLWITEFQDPSNRRAGVTFHWEKAADYLVRQIRYMQKQGFNIAYMDSKNECCLFLRPGDIGRMIDRVRKQLGSKMPLVIAPSSHNRAAGQAWLEEAMKIGRTDFFDIISTHKTDQQKGTFEDFMGVAGKLRKPVWNTEMHGFEGPDDLAVANSIHLWQHARAGFSGMNDWLSLGDTGKDHKMFRNVSRDLEVMRTYYIFKQLVNSSGGGNYLYSTIPSGLTSTAAFVQGNRVTVWALNSSATPVKGVVVQLDGIPLASPSVDVLRWGPDNGREGTRGRVAMTPGAPFTQDIDANALYCFTFTKR